MFEILIDSIDKKVSRIGLGTVKLGRNQQVKYPSSFVIPDDKDALALLAKATELGINLIDTAPAYGNSEQRLGKLLTKINNDWVIVSKAGEEFNGGVSSFDFRSESIVLSVERSLHRLNREAIDIMLIHSNGEDSEIIERYQVFDTLERLKNQGKILASGMSVKTTKGAIITIQHSDLLMYERSQNPVDDEEVAQYALDYRKQILIKKAFVSGHSLCGENRKQSIERSFTKSFAMAQVASIIIGTINPDHLAMNYSIANEMLSSEQYKNSCI